MIVILCHPGDAAALWLGEAMRYLHAGEVELVAVEELVFSRRIVYRLSGAGDSGSIELADGRTLRPEAITGLVNRVCYLPTQHFARAQTADRAYAEAELSAFLLAWINGVAGRVVNPPLPFALGGGTFPPATVAHLASMAGLPTEAWRAGAADDGDGKTLPSSTHAVLLFDGRVFGPLLPRNMQEACRRLAALLGVSLLQIELRQSPELGWRFVAASGLADFRIGGKPLARALARTLARKSAA
jgi:hypothetical protein